MKDILHLILEGGFVTGLVAVCGFLWKMASDSGSIKASLNLLLNNHLPHLEDEVRDLKNQFVQHLEKHQ